MIAREPSTTDRDRGGRFVPGNKAAKGNPNAKLTAKLRSVILRAVTEAEMRAVTKKLVESAKGGDLAATRLLFEYTIGKPLEADLVERLDALEVTLQRSEYG